MGVLTDLYYCDMIRIHYLNISYERRYMTKQDQIRELEQRLGREIAIELVKNEAHTIITEDEAEKELLVEIEEEL